MIRQINFIFIFLVLILLFRSPDVFAGDRLDVIGLASGVLDMQKKSGVDPIPKNEIRGDCEVTTFFCNRIDVELFDSKKKSAGRARPDKDGFFYFVNLNPSETYSWAAKTDKGQLIGQSAGLKSGTAYKLAEPVK